MKASRVLVLLAIATLSLQGFASDHEIDPRLKNVKRLLHTSSGAKQVLASEDPAVLELHQNAKSLFEEAQQAFSAGDDEKGALLRDQATKVMFGAIRMARPSVSGDNKLIADYKKRRDSVDTLNDAFNRIADELKLAESKEKTNQQLNELTTQAEALAAKGKHPQAKIEIDKAYHLLQASIQSLREGQTLVRSLNFATEEEEYDYEMDRNSTHKMLMTLFLDGKKLSSYTQTNVDKFTAAAIELRQQAEQAAGNGDYAEAIKLLEKSTKHLVRSIRSAGIYIPG